MSNFVLLMLLLSYVNMSLNSVLRISVGEERIMECIDELYYSYSCTKKGKECICDSLLQQLKQTIQI